VIFATCALIVLVVAALFEENRREIEEAKKLHKDPRKWPIRLTKTCG
jgi:hypothetical protein